MGEENIVESKGKTILVTGGNAGIGYALCRQLVSEHRCKVFMGTRSVERGEAAVESIRSGLPSDIPKDNIQLLLLDVSNDESIAAAAADLRNQLGKENSLYALVNNAGVGYQTHTDANDVDGLLRTNFHGVKNVSDAFVGFIGENGRIVNVSSGGASEWLAKQNRERKSLFSNPSATWEELVAAVDVDKEHAIDGNDIYCLSKAAVTAHTIQQAAVHHDRNIKCVSLNPGFIETNMSRGYGAKLSAEEGTVSLLKCLFGAITSGAYYGADGMRAPVIVPRDIGMPEYEGEENPDTMRYMKQVPAVPKKEVESIPPPEL